MSMHNRPEGWLSSEDFQNLARPVRVAFAPMNPAASDVAEVRWAEREHYKTGPAKGIQVGDYIVFAPRLSDGTVEDRLSFSQYRWRFGPEDARNSYEVAIELAQRMTDIAHHLGYTGVYGIAMGAWKHTKPYIMVATPLESDRGHVCHESMSVIVAGTNGMLVREGIERLQLPLPNEGDGWEP